MYVNIHSSYCVVVSTDQVYFVCIVATTHAVNQSIQVHSITKDVNILCWALAKNHKEWWYKYQEETSIDCLPNPFMAALSLLQSVSALNEGYGFTVPSADGSPQEV